MLYSAAFDTSEISGVGTLTIKTSGKPDLVINLATDVTGAAVDGTFPTKFFHWQLLVFQGLYIHSQDPTAVHRRTELSVTPWESALSVRAAALATSAGWSSPTSILFSMDLTTGLVTVAYTTTFQLVWSTSVGRSLCGFSADKSGAASYTGTVVPNYVIVPTLSAVSVDNDMDGGNYEPAGIASQSIADDASNYGIEREVSPLFRDWIQQYESKAKTERASAASTHPETFQSMREHCRCRWPFIVHDGFGSSTDEVFSFRDVGAQWRRQRASLANDSQFHIPHQTIVEGSIDLAS